jgi:hypothetical protein
MAQMKSMGVLQRKVVKMKSEASLRKPEVHAFRRQTMTARLGYVDFCQD